ncbi:putative transporter C543.05c [Trichoderma asperellum]|uniref:Putative transporter C543.05c n=1 Tax=Trichoderma asperellum TaxID=101201 RepID=A0A6V8QS16_TRIAP|nr:putative transporter C543.05c [Trichoderma asperellum]
MATAATATSTPSDGGASMSTTRRDDEAWWSIHPFRGMVNDIRRRAPYYVSDWLDAWDYRVVPATVFMYFANILPALAFSLDMFQNTGSNYGVNEVLLASVLGSVVFSIFSAQPLVIVGVTGPITVFNSTVYNIMKPTGVNYLGFMAWIGIWSLILHWILAITNSCNWLRWVTRFPCDIFGFYVAFIYLQKGIQVLERLGSDTAFYLSIVAALLLFIVAYICSELGASSLFRHPIRVFLKDYGTPLTLVFFTGFVHIGRMAEVHLAVLPTSKAFEPTADRGWAVNFWDLSVGQIFTALPFAILLTILFWFDHNVSSLIAQGSEFPLRKPAGFHWDFFLLGITTGVAGILGLPFPNGLIPQAPFHTESLCVTKAVKQLDEKGEDKAQGLLTLGTMTGPLLVVLHLVPHGVLAGLFFIMGVQALQANGITAKLLFLARDKNLTPANSPLKLIKRRVAIWMFVIIELIGFGATFAITQTIAAVGFPIIILLLIPVRALLLPRIFHPDELMALDEPTASDFTMEGIGGSWGGGQNEPQSSEDTPIQSRSSSSSRRTNDASDDDAAARYKAQEDLAELGQVQNTQNTMTRRRSIDKRASRLRRGSILSDTS